MAEEKKDQTPIVFDGGFETTIDGDVATLVYKDENHDHFYSGTDLPKSQIDAVFKYMEQYHTAAVNECAKQTTETLVNNPNVNTVVVKTPFTPSARGYISTTTLRNKEWPKTAINPEGSSGPYMSIDTKLPQASMTRARVKQYEKAIVDALNT